ncbi:MAG: hydrolase [Micavibrio sp.]|nr:MAG: hydrolase [Micavibrio sp.]
MDKIFTISKPDQPLPLIFDSPHSGALYPDDFNYACDFEILARAEDKHVDELFALAPNYGGTLLAALFPRSYIDPNRAACDIDPDLLAEKWPDGSNPTARSDAGIGLIRRLVRPGVPVYDRSLSIEEVQQRIEKYYQPYHDALKKLVDDTHYNFGQVWHINCHSMPSSSARPRQPIGLIGNQSKSVDFCLGDRDGTSCSKDFTHGLRDFIKAMGYSVTTNDPFKGVELVARHAEPARGRHSLQIEINKALYLNEEKNQKSDDYPALQKDVEQLVSFCATYVEQNLVDLAAD